MQISRSCNVSHFLQLCMFILYYSYSIHSVDSTHNPQRITLYLGGRSFYQIRSWRFLVEFLHGSPWVLDVGLFIGSNHLGFLSDWFVDCLLSFGLVRSWIFLVVLLQHTLLFLGVVLFVRVWRDFLQRSIELGHCGLDVLCGGPRPSTFFLSVKFFVRSNHQDWLLDHWSGLVFFCCQSFCWIR